MIELGKNFTEFPVNINAITFKPFEIDIFKGQRVKYKNRECIIRDLDSQTVVLSLFTNNPNDCIRIDEISQKEIKDVLEELYHQENNKREFVIFTRFEYVIKRFNELMREKSLEFCNLKAVKDEKDINKSDI